MPNLLRFIHHTFWALVTGERVYLLVIRPDKRKHTQYTKGMSGALINDGYVSVVNKSIARGEVRREWTPEEREEFNIPPHVK